MEFEKVVKLNVIMTNHRNNIIIILYNTCRVFSGAPMDNESLSFLTTSLGKNLSCQCFDLRNLVEMLARYVLPKVKLSRKRTFRCYLFKSIDSTETQQNLIILMLKC